MSLRRSQAMRTLVCALAATALAYAAGSELFNDRVIQSISLQMAPADWASLQQNYQADTYYHAQLSWNGISVDVGIRSRGAGSRSPYKPNFDINVDKYVHHQTIDGLSFFVLTANNQDPSDLHEVLSFKFFQRMGIPAPRTAPSQVYLNGQILGYYTATEHEDDDFVDRVFGEHTGYLYEWEFDPNAPYHFNWLGSDPNLYAKFLDLKSDQDTPDLQTFTNLVAAVNATASDQDYITRLSQYINPAFFMEYAAIENVMSQSDGLLSQPVGMNNFFLYQFDGTTLYTLMPWDQDAAFFSVSGSILTGISDNVLANRLYQIQEYRDIYLNTLVKAAETWGDTDGWVGKELERQYNLIRNAALNDPHQQCLGNQTPGPCQLGAFENEISNMRAFVAGRRSSVLTQVSATQGNPVIQAEPFVASVISQDAPGAKLVPGSLAVVTGYNLGATMAASSSDLPRVLGSTTVAINGERAPLMSLTPEQIVFQVPTDIDTGAASLVVHVNELLSTSKQIEIANAASGSGPLIVQIDIPNRQSGPFLGSVSLSGWAVDTQAAIQSLTVAVDGAPVGAATSGVARPDVCAAYQDAINCPGPGWTYILDTTRLASGVHTFSVTATDADAQSSASGTTFVVANWASAASDPVRMNIDAPAANTSVSGVAHFGGWAIDDISAVTGIAIAVDGVVQGQAAYGGVRSDVCNAFPNRSGCPNVGWDYSLDTSGFADGNHTLTITAVVPSGTNATLSRLFTVSNHATNGPVYIAIDKPNSQSAPLQAVVHLAGWAVADNSPIAQVSLTIDGVAAGDATYGTSRSDVCAHFTGHPGCPNVGWDLIWDTTVLPDGNHTLGVTASTTDGQRNTLAASFATRNGSASNPTHLFLDQPAGAEPLLAGIVPLSGWALNDNAAIASVTVLVDNVPQDVASYGASRPDVCLAYPARPGCPSVGWNFLLDTSHFANGTHEIAIAAAAENGARSSLNRSVTVANWSTGAPIQISIGKPDSSLGVLSGTIPAAGWAISNVAPITAVSLAIDGRPLGQAAYGASRPDVCEVFPGRSGCPNVGWNFLLDTTQIGDGAHQLAVTASDSDGLSATASKSITVANLSGTNALRIGLDAPGADEVLSGFSALGGWALDTSSAVVSVTILVDGVPQGTAIYGGSRPDACLPASQQGLGCPNVGWDYELDTTKLVNGDHTLDVLAQTQTGQTGMRSVQFEVRN